MKPLHIPVILQVFPSVEILYLRFTSWSNQRTRLRLTLHTVFPASSEKIEDKTENPLVDYDTLKNCFKLQLRFYNSVIKVSIHSRPVFIDIQIAVEYREGVVAFYVMLCRLMTSE